MRKFDRSLHIMLLKARKSIMRKLMPHLHRYDITPQQWRVLRALYEKESMHEQELSEACYVLQPTLQTVLIRLENRYLIQKEQSEDGGLCYYALRQEGFGLARKMSSESEARYERIKLVFGEQKLEALYELLNEFIDKMEEADETDKELGFERRSFPRKLEYYDEDVDGLSK